MVSIFVVLALLLAQQTPYSRKLPGSAPEIMPEQRDSFVPGKGFLNLYKAQPKCSVPLMYAPAVKTPERQLPIPASRWFLTDPKMIKAAPAPPCPNWFAK